MTTIATIETIANIATIATIATIVTIATIATFATIATIVTIATIATMATIATIATIEEFDRAIRPPSYFGFCDHSEENSKEDSVSASQRFSDDEQVDSSNETEDKIKNEEQHTGATQQLRVMTLSEQDHYPVVPITENVTNCLFDAFGGSLDISKDVQETKWGNRWTVSVNLQGKLYLVPGGTLAVNTLIF